MMILQWLRCRGYPSSAVIFILLGLVTVPSQADAESFEVPDWLEPRGLSIVELVGQVPDEYLRGSIISYGTWDGIVVYESGARVGNTVVVTTKIYPRLDTPSWAPDNKLALFGCLGQSPHYDHMGTVVPASTLRVYDEEGREVTDQIKYMRITRMDARKPSADSTQPFRYLPEDDYGPNTNPPLLMGPAGLVIPANSGCWIRMPGVDYQVLTGVFTLEVEPGIQASVLGAQRASFQSYVGPGGVGILQPLMDQMDKAFGWRDSRIPLSVPAGASHFMVKFPPMPVDPYSFGASGPDHLNADRPSSGTYRLSGNSLGTDLTCTSAFPLRVSWLDADLAGRSQFLPLLANVRELATPEYVVPAGVAFDSCFLRGDCPPSVLQEIWEAEMSLEVIYLRVDRMGDGGQWIPIHMAGPSYQQQVTAAGNSDTVSPGPVSTALEAKHQVFIPLASNGGHEQVACECPCGWFDELGRMLDYCPGP